jgi:hypothetical protein
MTQTGHPAVHQIYLLDDCSLIPKAHFSVYPKRENGTFVMAFRIGIRTRRFRYVSVTALKIHATKWHERAYCGKSRHLQSIDVSQRLFAIRLFFFIQQNSG